MIYVDRFRNLCGAILDQRIEQEQKSENTEQEQPAEKSADQLCSDCLRKTKVNFAELYLSLTTAQLSSALNSQSLYAHLCRFFHGEVSFVFL